LEISVKLSDFIKIRLAVFVFLHDNLQTERQLIDMANLMIVNFNFSLQTSQELYTAMHFYVDKSENNLQMLHFIVLFSLYLIKYSASAYGRIFEK
jgi:hypothetical protein